MMRSTFLLAVLLLAVTPMVFCGPNVTDGDWTIFQRRKDGRVNFKRTWDEYRAGFGDAGGEFWMGLDGLRAMTASGNYELRIDLESGAGTHVSETYSNFAIGSANSKFRLSNDLSAGTGNAGDSLLIHRGKKFSTFDSDNDSEDGESCSQTWESSWWFGRCAANKVKSSLNGPYPASCNTGECYIDFGKGIIWTTYSGMYLSLKKSEMRFRQVA